MENYRKQISNRIRLLGAGVAFGGVVTFAARELGGRYVTYSGDFMRGFMSSFPLGLIFGWTVLMLVLIFRYNSALRDDEKLREMKIKEEDERTRLIREKAGGLGFNLTIGALAVAGIAACFLNVTVAITLFAVMLGMSLIKGGLKLYYLNKY